MQDKFSLANRNLSFWEKQALSTRYDFVVVGAGLVGLSTSLSLREKYPQAEILILERSNIPYGASTRNAGFACFGSITEILADINKMSIDPVANLISDRWNGLQLLRERVGDSYLDYQALGGYEVFRHEDSTLFESSIEQLGDINQLIENSIGLKDCFSSIPNRFGIKGHNAVIYNQYEGQLHPGLMIRRLTDLAHENRVKILYGANVTGYEAISDSVSLTIENRDQLYMKGTQVFFTTNAFTTDVVPSLDIQPSRNQVMITKPIKDLPIKGCFHYDHGFVYFRNFENRLLIGGGRNIALDAEATDEFAMTEKIQNYLRQLLEEFLLPSVPIEEDMWWSGIIATGGSKAPIIRSIAPNVHLGVRLSGMGVALGSIIGQKLAGLV